MIVFLALAALLQSPSSPSREFVSKADRYMRAQVTVNGFAGSILIAKEDKILLSEAYGVPPAKSRGSHTSEKRFRVGSVGKQFTDLAVLQLQEKGSLYVQDSVCRYISNCPSDWNKITLFDLMTHTSGIPAIAALPARSAKALNRSALLEQIEREPLRFSPGEKVDGTYSEEEVLEAVVETASGEPYLTYLHRHIFAPAGMVHTGYDEHLRSLSNHEVATLLPSDMQQSLLYTAGGVYSTTKDLFLWNRALATGKLVSAKSVKEMFTPYRDGYGFGWTVQEEIGRTLLTEGGGLSTYSSSIFYYPDDGVDIVVLSRSEATDAQKVGRDLAAILFGEHYELPTEHKVIALDPKTYVNYVGQYSVAPNFVLTVTKDADRLMIGRAGMAKIELFPESEEIFLLKGSSSRIAFVTGPNGRAGQLVLQQGGRDISAQRIDQPLSQDGR